MNNIRLIRGDTLHIEISIVDQDGNEYIPTNEDQLVFTLKKNTSSNEILLQKDLPTRYLHINVEDTKNLTYGTYKFDIQLTQENGDVTTVIPPSDFIVMEEVNFE